MLARWNLLPIGSKQRERFCRVAARPRGLTGWQRADRFADEATLLAASDETWRNLTEADWMEAFRSHPQNWRVRNRRVAGIGQNASAQVFALVRAGTRERCCGGWRCDQGRAGGGNEEYERRFNHIFIVCATGKSAPEILGILRRRLQNDSKTELHEAAEQQRQITHIRLKKWLSE